MKRYQMNLLLLFVTLFAIGCGPSGGQNVVRGQVTFSGTPVDGGIVVIEGGGSAFTTEIVNGSFEVTAPPGRSLPVGKYRVVVLPPEPKLVVDRKTTNMRIAETVDTSQFPKRYRQAETSGLSLIVEPGVNLLDIAMQED